MTYSREGIAWGWHVAEVLRSTARTKYPQSLNSNEIKLNQIKLKPEAAWKGLPKPIFFVYWTHLSYPWDSHRVYGFLWRSGMAAFWNGHGGCFHSNFTGAGIASVAWIATLCLCFSPAGHNVTYFFAQKTLNYLKPDHRDGWKSKSRCRTVNIKRLGKEILAARSSRINVFK